MPLPPGVYRADHIGSLLRPSAIKSARADLAAGKISASDLHAAEDNEIAALVQKQLDAGLRSVTDGEQRRAYFHLDFLQQLHGVSVKGSIQSSGAIKDGWQPPSLAVTGQLGHPERAVQVEDYVFLRDMLAKTLERSGENATAKVCVPSPTMLHFRGGRASIDIESYPEMDDFFDDLAAVYQQELDALYKAGARFVQLDDTNLAYLCDEKMRQAAVERNEDPDELPKKYAVSCLGRAF
jgi:5-methyltetrahydropteroyltriglutamate--homocysteine methyltransferase